MSDKDTIQAAYEQGLKELFAVFWKKLPGATVAEIKDAEQRFKDGVHVCRDARDRATQLL